MGIFCDNLSFCGMVVELEGLDKYASIYFAIIFKLGSESFDFDIDEGRREFEEKMASRMKEDERNEKVIRGLLKLPANRRCINCNNLVSFFFFLLPLSSFNAIFV